MSSSSRESHLAYACMTAGISLLLSTAAWAETIHLNVPTVRVKPVAVRVKPTVHLPVSAGLGKQHLSKGSTAPGRWHGPNKGDTTNGSTTPASPGAAAYSATVNAPAGAPVGYVAGQKGATKGGTTNPATGAGGPTTEQQVGQGQGETPPGNGPGSPGYQGSAGKPPAGTTAGEKGTPVVGVPVLQTLGLGPDWFANTRNGIGRDPMSFGSSGCDTCVDWKKVGEGGLGAIAFVAAAYVAVVTAPADIPAGVGAATFLGSAASVTLIAGQIIDGLTSPSPTDPSAGANNYGPGTSAPGGAPAPGSGGGGSGKDAGPPQAAAVNTQALGAVSPDAGIGDTGAAKVGATPDSGGGGTDAPKSGTPMTAEAAQLESGAPPADDTNKPAGASTTTPPSSNGGGASDATPGTTLSATQAAQVSGAGDAPPDQTIQDAGSGPDKP
jgi:hypothetical protein